MTHQPGLGLISSISNAGRIDPQDVLGLRRMVFQDNAVAIAEADAMIELDMDCPEKCPEWVEFFLEALTDFTVRQMKPEGHISEENAAWLIRAISRDGRIAAITELELLIRVLEVASSAPASLSNYALKQVADAVLDGSGPLAKGGQLEPGVINAYEVHLIRRILHAMSGPGGLSVTREEAELLFRMNERSLHDANDSSWNDVFVKSIANYVCGHSRHTLASREDALRHYEFLESDTGGTAGFLGRMFSGGLSEVREAIANPTSMSRDTAPATDRDAEVAASERVDAIEARWLADKIGSDGQMHDNERALLKFIGNISIDIHDDLKPLMAKVA